MEKLDGRHQRWNTFSTPVALFEILKKKVFILLPYLISIHSMLKYH